MRLQGERARPQHFLLVATCAHLGPIEEALTSMRVLPSIPASRSILNATYLKQR